MTETGEIVMSSATLEKLQVRKIPVIDVSRLRSTAEAKRAVAKEFREACTATGFFYVVGHGVSPALIERVFKQSGSFFALPMEQKLALASAQSPCRHGYEPLK